MMENRWSDEDALGLDELGLLVYRSNLLGADPTVTNPGGGNTSVKRLIPDFQGREVEVLTVKASGADLASAGQEHFADLRLEDLLPLRDRAAMTDEEMVEYLRHCLMDPAAPRPSIETLLHAFVPSRNVDHVHANVACAFANARRGEEALREAFGEEAAWVPYVRPGYAIAKLALETLDRHPASRFLVLQKHGLVTWAQDARSSYQGMLEFVRRGGDYLAERSKKVFGSVAIGPSPDRTSIAAGLMPQLRGELGRIVLHYDDSPEVLEFAGSERGQALAEMGLALPDHVLSTKVRPLFLTMPAPEGIVRYREEYEGYFRRYAGSDEQPDDANPRVVLVPGVGMITAGRDKRAAAVTAANYRQAIAIMRGAEAVGEFAPLTEEEAYHVEYWPLERYKLTLIPPPKELAGRVALVTGGAGAIGRALCRGFAEAGAHVVVADLNLAGADEVAAECGAAIAARVDVTDEASVRRAMEQAALAYGGLDVLVCNAGVAFSHPVEETTLQEWDRTMAVLSTGYFLTAKEGIALMRKQGLGGSIIFVASKAGLAAARNASAYASAKAAALHLARCLAEEVAGDGIRVNSLAPDAIIEGSGLWAGQWGAARAAAHGVPRERLADFYRDRNLLKVGVTAEDVAEAALFFASDRSRATTGAILSVDGGLHDGYVR